VLLKSVLAGLAVWAANANAPSEFHAAMPFLKAATDLSFAALLWYVLVRWQRRLKQGQQPWFVRWSARWMWMAVGAALVAPPLVPGFLPLLQDAGPSARAGAALIVLMSSAEVLAVLLQACAWLWWCDRPPRVAKGLLGATVAWVTMRSHFTLFRMAAPVLVIGQNTATYHGHALNALAQGSFSGVNAQWAVVWSSEVFPGGEAYFHSLALLVSTGVAYIAVSGLLAWGLYRLTRIVSGWIAARHVWRQAAR
jgi:hypothetical protein